MPAAPLGLDWVSPLPPVRSGIADYSADMLPHVGRLSDVRALVLAGETPSPELRRRVATAPLAEGDATDRVRLYHMGNNRYHLEVLRAARRVPGVLLLHDFVLHHLLLDRTVGRGEFEAYERELAGDEGWPGRDVARVARWGAVHQSALFALPAHRQLLRSQRGVLVHSAWAADSLRDEDPELEVAVVPMGVPLPEPVDPARGRGLRAELGIPEDAPLLGSFGFQTHIKRTASAVAALARPGLERAHLLIVGEEDPFADLDGAVRRSGASDRIHRLGYVAFDRLQEAIAAVDACLNLRYPTAGETSASLLRVLATGQPAVVTAYGPMRDLPDDVVVAVEPGAEEVDRLAVALRDLLANPERLAAMGERARRYVVENHDPERAAARLVEACAAMRDLVPPGPDRPEAPPISCRLRPALAAGFAVRGHDSLRPGARGPVAIGLENRGETRWLAAKRGAAGVLVRIRIYPPHGDHPIDERWLGLPRDLDPGEACTVEARLRRPPGPARLEVRLALADTEMREPVLWEGSFG